MIFLGASGFEATEDRKPAKQGKRDPSPLLITIALDTNCAFCQPLEKALLNNGDISVQTQGSYISEKRRYIFPLCSWGTVWRLIRLYNNQIEFVKPRCVLQ